MKKNSMNSFHLKNRNNFMVLNFHDFKQQFASKLMTNLPYQQEQYSVGGCFYQGVDDALKIILELYESGTIVLTFKTAPKIGINNIADYAQYCVVNDDVDLDELDYPLLTRYYYSGVKQILDILNHNFNVKYHG